MAQGEKIAEKIINDALIKASESVSDAQTKANEILLKAQEFENLKKEDLEQVILKNEKILKEKYDTLYRIESNKFLLKTKQNVIKKLKEKVVLSLYNLEKQDAKNFVEKLINKNASTNEIIYFNIKNLTQKDIEDMKIVHELSLKVKESKDNKYGLIISNNECDKNLLFSTLVDSIFDENEEKISKNLFS